MLIFVVNIRPARTFWNSTHCLLSPFTLDWSRNLWHNPMWNMAVNNISYPIYPLSTRTEKGTSPKWYLSFFVQYIYTLAKLLIWLWYIRFQYTTGRFSEQPPAQTSRERFHGRMKVKKKNLTFIIAENTRSVKKINSFAANFLTNLFSQCHIYFNNKGYHVFWCFNILLNLYFTVFTVNSIL